MSEYEITRSLLTWKETQSTSYLVVDNQRINKHKNMIYLMKKSLYALMLSYYIFNMNLS